MTAAKNLPPFVAHAGANQELSIVGVVGTLGTSDTGGTAPILPFGVNPATGAMYVQDLSGVSGTTNIQGSVQITGGTLNAGTFNNTGTNVNVVTGTLTTGSLSNVAMVNAGTFVQASGTTTLVTTVTTLSNLTNGSVNILTGTIQSSGTSTGVGVVSNLTNGSVNILTGTLQSLGTTTGVGVVSSLTTGTINLGTFVNNGGSVSIQGLQANAALAVGNPFPAGGTDAGGTVRSNLVDATGVQRSSGSQVMTVGTVTTGTLQNLVTGTINALAAGTVTAGTLTNLVSGTINAIAAGTITTGTVSMTTGTLNGGTLSNLNAGTITALATGTITGGTLGNLNYGTINIDPKPIPVKTLRTTYGTTGTTGAAVFGTLVASVGNGTFVYIAGYQIVVESGTVLCAITDGTFNQATLPAGGTNMITRGNFPAGGGIARDLSVPYVSGTGGTICYWMGGAGTAYFQIDYWAST